MKESLLDIVVCPLDKADLDLEVDERDDDGNIVAGTLTCTECGEAYPIEESIPNLLPPDMQDEQPA